MAGVAYAAIQLEPPHISIGIPRRLSLPLPSHSMLQDLWDYIISTDGGLIFEIVFFKSLSLFHLIQFLDFLLV